MNELTANFDDNLLDDGLKLFFTIVKAETGKVLRILSRLLSKLRRFLERVCFKNAGTDVAKKLYVTVLKSIKYLKSLTMYKIKALRVS